MAFRQLFEPVYTAASHGFQEDIRRRRSAGQPFIGYFRHYQPFRQTEGPTDSRQVGTADTPPSPIAAFTPFSGIAFGHCIGK